MTHTFFNIHQYVLFVKILYYLFFYSVNPSEEINKVKPNIVLQLLAEIDFRNLAYYRFSSSLTQPEQLILIKNIIKDTKVESRAVNDFSLLLLDVFS